MDKEIERGFATVGEYIGTLGAQYGLMACAIEALIATHPDRASLRCVFDQLWAQVQVGPPMMELPAADRNLARQLAEKWFSDNP